MFIYVYSIVIGRYKWIHTLLQTTKVIPTDVVHYLWDHDSCVLFIQNKCLIIIHPICNIQCQRSQVRLDWNVATAKLQQ